MEASSEPIAGDGVTDRQREEDERNGEHDDVQHGDAPSDGRFGACSRWVPASHYLDLRREPADTCAVQAPLPVTHRIGIREGCADSGIGIL